MKVSPIHQLLLLSFTILSIVFSVTTASKVEFSYIDDKGPQFWHLLENSSLLCLKGRRQSPINIDVLEPKIRSIRPSDVRVKNIDEAELAHIVTTLEVAPGKEEEGEEGRGEKFLPAQFEIGGEAFNLLQFHFHTPSEHRVNGVHHDVEMHMVFKDRKERISVVAVFFDIGSIKDNEFLKSVLIKEIPRPNGSTKLCNIPLKKLFEDINYIQNAFTYLGSLTTPPCTEGVRWWVNDKHVQYISSGQYRRLKNTIGNFYVEISKKAYRKLSDSQDINAGIIAGLYDNVPATVSKSRG
ncbi:4584_t:CDS:2 [Cetraspora pellucida]|uniref:Carbonic anhydrase n=1 Tax=Cetraspora pellucida TaxID=1433469 RepID=A0A9N9A2Z6_9GLOM|nr:4584_t:CDS:2 [Cetraspora pellucida]